MIQPAGLGGAPSCGQRAAATAKASWTASSARSISPKERTRTATARPYCSRKTCSIAEAVRGSDSVMRSEALRLVHEWAHLDRQPDHLGELATPLQRAVEVGRLDDGEPAQVLLAFGERAVGHQDLAVLAPQHGGRARGVQAAVEDPGTGVLGLLDHIGDALHDRAEHLGRRHGAAGRSVDAEQVLVHGMLHVVWGFAAAFRLASPSIRTIGARIDSGAK